MNSDNKINLLTLNGVIAALYAVLTLLNPLSYGVLQFRLSTLILPIAAYMPQVRAGLVLGAFIGNMNSSLGIIDMVVGTFIAFLCVCIISEVKNKLLQSFLYAIDSGLLVALELYYCFKAPILYSVVTVGVSGFIIYLIGLYVMEIVLDKIN